MKTITFYSYKGGVGRSLALSNIATRLSEFNKKVVVMDFDLEAPGLQFKFKRYRPSKPIENGLVDYIHSFSCQGILHEKISNYSVQLLPPNSIFSPINFIPAGNIDNASYWKKISMINWSELFYEEGGQGVKFFFDLKAKIEKEFAPDFLLIDSRTGITEMSGVTLKLLADDVVVLAANNDENKWGSKRIIKSLMEIGTTGFSNVPNIHFVLTRLPFKNTPHDRGKEQWLISSIKEELEIYFGQKEFDVSIIHSEEKLEERESLLMGYSLEENPVSISNDYLKLFYKITKGSLSKAEIDVFEIKKQAEQEFEKARKAPELSIKIDHITRAINLDDTNYLYYRERGHYFYKQRKFSEALVDFKAAHSFNPENSELLSGIGLILIELKKYDAALEYFDKALLLDYENVNAHTGKMLMFRETNRIKEAIETISEVIEQIDPFDDSLLNDRADLYRIQGEVSKAYTDIYQAIEMNSDNPMYFATLAEICAMDGKIEEFYLNLNIALSKQLKVTDLNSAKEVYQKFKNDVRFINILNKYSIDIEEIFKDE